MDREELMRLTDERLRAFSPAVHEAKQWALRVSSGTSDRGPIISPSRVDVSRLGEWYGDTKRVLLCYGPRATRLFNVLAIIQLGGDVLTLDDQDIVPERIPHIARFAPTNIVGFPSFIAKVAKALPEKTRLDVASLHMAGELISDTLDVSLREWFPNAALSALYVGTDMGAIAASCPHLPRNTYHPHAGVAVEIEQPDKDGAGDIVVSKEMGGEFVSRYRTGDIGRLYTLACPCGKTNAIELRGRAGRDHIKIAGALLHSAEVERVMAAHTTVVADYRVEAGSEVIRGALRGKVRFILYCPLMPTELLQGSIRQHIEKNLYLTPTRTLSQLSDEGIFEPLEVIFSTGVPPQSHKTSKMRQMPL